MDGEVGRLSFTTYRVESEEGQTLYNSANEWFSPLPGKAWYKTRGFKELAFVHGSMAESYRKTSQLINRVRHQPGATPSRTLQEQTEAEGVKIAAVVEEKVAQILRRHQFTAQVAPGDEAARYGPEEKRLANPGVVTAAIARCAKGDRELATLIAANVVGYEMTEATVAISIDDVGVKRQKERRQRSEGDEVAEAAPEEGVEHRGVSQNTAEPK